MKITCGQLRETIRQALSEANPILKHLSDEVQHDMRVIWVDNFLNMMFERGHTMEEMRAAVDAAFESRLQPRVEDQE